MVCEKNKFSWTFFRDFFAISYDVDFIIGYFFKYFILSIYVLLWGFAFGKLLFFNK